MKMSDKNPKDGSVDKKHFPTNTLAHGMIEQFK